MTEKMSNDIIEERVELYLKNKTYVYIRDIYSFNFNGFIEKDEGESILFKDSKLGIIPIVKTDIKIINVSVKPDGK